MSIFRWFPYYSTIILMHSVEFRALTTGLASSQSVDSIFCDIEMLVFDEYRDSLVIFFQNEHRTLFVDFQTFFCKYWKFSETSVSVRVVQFVPLSWCLKTFASLKRLRRKHSSVTSNEQEKRRLKPHDVPFLTIIPFIIQNRSYFSAIFLKMDAASAKKIQMNYNFRIIRFDFK